MAVGHQHPAPPMPLKGMGQPLSHSCAQQSREASKQSWILPKCLRQHWPQGSSSLFGRSTLASAGRGYYLEH